MAVRGLAAWRGNGAGRQEERGPRGGERGGGGHRADALGPVGAALHRRLVITLEPDVTHALGVRSSVSAVIVDRRGRLLLQQRSDGGQWGLPGGSVEIGESLAEAVRREVHGETGLPDAVRRLIGGSS